jgi:hypothetical protein
VLRDVTFQAPPGRLTALVGPSGAGKTTITHLVPRLYDAVRGAVRIGGLDVRDLTLESLRSVVGVVPQDAHLFHDTIRANLLYARPSATEKELTEACEAARIWKLISSLPDGLDTIAGDRMTSCSPGTGCTRGCTRHSSRRRRRYGRSWETSVGLAGRPAASVFILAGVMTATRPITLPPPGSPVGNDRRPGVRGLGGIAKGGNVPGTVRS